MKADHTHEADEQRRKRQGRQQRWYNSVYARCFLTDSIYVESSSCDFLVHENSSKKTTTISILVGAYFFLFLFDRYKVFANNTLFSLQWNLLD